VTTVKRRFSKIGRCELHSTAQICDGAIVGKLFRPFLDGTRESGRKTIIKKNVYVGHNAIVGNGSVIGSQTIIDDFAVVESRVVLGEKTLVIYHAQICNDAKVGSNCVIGGFIGERTKIGNGCRIFGKIVHLQHEPQKGWDAEDVVEPAATIKERAFVAFGAVISGPVIVGRKAYVCSGAIVTKDVPPKHIVRGVNEIIPFAKWPGRLKRSPFFRD
jgi:acetyltransferase-like isoleucine patch superfamily enzyme